MAAADPPPAAATSTAAAITAAASGSACQGPNTPSGSTFQVLLSGERSLSIRVDTPTQRALWVKEILRLASWRAVHLLQLELASEWQPVQVLPGPGRDVCKGLERTPAALSGQPAPPRRMTSPPQHSP